MISIKKILCPVDFFAASQSALQYAAALAAGHNAKLKLLHVVEPIISMAYPYPSEIANPTGPMKKEAERQLKKMLAKVKAEDVSIETEVTAGDVDLEIKRVVKTYKPDLIAMGTHGRRGFELWFMGSTTERLLRHSPVPMLTIADQRKRRGDVSRFRRILVTTDFSDGTPDALEYAFTIAQENDAHITLLHIADNLPPKMSGEDKAVFFREIDRKLLELVPNEVRNWCDVDTRIEKGTPYQAILNMIQREKIDLVVMNIHGKGMLERALLGSTAERVVRAAQCPIILVPPMGKAAKKMGSRKRAVGRR